MYAQLHLKYQVTYTDDLYPDKTIKPYLKIKARMCVSVYHIRRYSKFSHAATYYPLIVIAKNGHNSY